MFAGDTQRGPAGHQDPQLGAGREQFGDQGAASSTCSKLSSSMVSGYAHRLSWIVSTSGRLPSGRPSVSAIAKATSAASPDRGETDKATAVKLARGGRRYPLRQASFANAARASGESGAGGPRW